MTTEPTYAIFYRYPDGWGQLALMGETEARKTLASAKPGYVTAVDCWTNEIPDWGKS